MKNPEYTCDCLRPWRQPLQPGWPNAPVRTLRTPFVEEWLGREARGQDQCPDEPVLGETRLGGMIIPITRFSSLPPTVDTTGEIEKMDLLAGPSAGLVSAAQGAEEIVRELAAEAVDILRNRLPRAS